MVVEERYEGEKTYKCEKCDMHYREQELAEKCEEYCSEQGMCNSEITEKSIERSGK